jgi:hypothetical protein
MKELFIAVVPTLSLACVMALTGCSSAPKVSANKPQYCNTSQTIKTKNGENVNSETIVECTDDIVKKLTIVKAGMVRECGQYTDWMKIKGKDVQYKSISCEIRDSRGDIVLMDNNVR